MPNVQWGSMILAALVGSGAILTAMYLLLPALGLPRLDFAAVTGGWVKAGGPYAKVIGVAIFVLGGIGWAFLYAALWPWHSFLGGIGFVVIPFAISCVTLLPSLNQFQVLITPMPGFIWLKLGGPNALIANAVEHIVFGICLGLLYR